MVDGLDVNFSARQNALLEVLGSIGDPQERLSWAMNQAGRETAVGPEPEWRTADWLVRGCAARLWLKSEFREGRCMFRADSDSALLKAMSTLLCQLYSGLPPADVVAGEPEFLERSGLLHQLTENRQRTVHRMRQVIREFASGCIEADARA